MIPCFLSVIHEFAREGIAVDSALTLCPELLVPLPESSLAVRWFGGSAADISFGWQLAKKMGELDVGQSVAVKDRAVLAVEAVEGTDQAILRARHPVSGRRLHRRQGGQTQAGHAASTCPPSAPSRSRPSNAAGGPRPGHRSRQDHRPRPAGNHRPGGPLRAGHRFVDERGVWSGRLAASLRRATRMSVARRRLAAKRPDQTLRDFPGARVVRVVELPDEGLRCGCLRPQPREAAILKQGMRSTRDGMRDRHSGTRADRTSRTWAR